MRSSALPRQRRVVTQLCSACRREAMTASSRALPLATRGMAAAPSPRKPNGVGEGLITPLSTPRWLSHTSRPQKPSRGGPAEQQQPHQSPDGGTPPPATSSSTSSPSPPSMPTYYALFPKTLPNGPPPSGPFHIDVRALRSEFLRLQATAHPDLDGGSGAASALINEAYRTLASPLHRAQYLLHEKFGLDVAGDEAGELWTPEPEVLGAVMEARETVEEAVEESELESLREENEERISRAEEVLGEAFASGDVEAAKREVVRLRYWMNVRESIDNWESGKPVVLEH